MAEQDENVEIMVIEICAEALAPLDHDQRRRVFIYLADLYRVLIEKCPARKPHGFKSPARECYLPAGHPGAHQGWGTEWHDVEMPDE